MAIKPIIIHDKEEEKDYTLEFNRDSIRFAEARGFNISQIEDAPMTKLPELFWLSFRMHHSNVSKDKADKLLEKMGGFPDGMIERLGMLYAEPFNTLVQETNEDNPKNSKVTVEM